MLEDLKYSLLGRPVEIDDQIAAEHDVIRHLRGQLGIKQVAGLKIHASTNFIGNFKPVGDDAEKPLAVTEVAAAKRVFAIKAMHGLGNGNRADIDGIDLELSGINPSIEQCHGDGVRLLASRARQTENAQRANAGKACDALTGEHAQCHERFRVTKKPGLGHDHCFDQRLLLLRRRNQQVPIVVTVSAVGRRRALTQGALDDRLADRGHIQTDAVLEEAEKARVIGFHDASSSRSRSMGGTGYSNSRTGSLNNS